MTEEKELFLLLAIGIAICMSVATVAAVVRDRASKSPSTLAQLGRSLAVRFALGLAGAVIPLFPTYLSRLDGYGAWQSLTFLAAPLAAAMCAGWLYPKALVTSTVILTSGYLCGVILDVMVCFTRDMPCNEWPLGILLVAVVMPPLVLLGVFLGRALEWTRSRLRARWG